VVASEFFPGLAVLRPRGSTAHLVTAIERHQQLLACIRELPDQVEDRNLESSLRELGQFFESGRVDGRPDVLG
jgi:hypothetical protein